MTAAIGFLPGHDLKVEQRRVLLHATERGYDLVGLAIGERGWPGCEQMVATGAAQVVVTASKSGGHTEAPFVEVAGSGRLTLRTPQRAARLRRIADLVDSGLSDEMILKVLRGV